VLADHGLEVFPDRYPDRPSARSPTRTAGTFSIWSPGEHERDRPDAAIDVRHEAPEEAAPAEYDDVGAVELELLSCGLDGWLEVVAIGDVLVGEPLP
jgi:hypothetical protein